MVSSLRSHVQYILHDWSLLSGPCGHCPFNVVENEPEFARGSEKAEVMIVAQNPGGDGIVGKREWEPQASAYFDGYMRKAIEEGWLGIRVLQGMTSGTKCASLRDVYYTNLCKCHSFDGKKGLSVRYANVVSTCRTRFVFCVHEWS